MAAVCGEWSSKGNNDNKESLSTTIESVRLGGLEQKILISTQKSDNKSNDIILLFLHGGGTAIPGISSKHDFPLLQQHYVCVFWDQRGTGASYRPNLTPEELTLDKFVADTLELTRLLKKRYPDKKVHLVGHSWGAVVGIRAVLEAPNEYAGYIGVSQPIHVTKTDQDGWQMLHDKFQQEKSTSSLQQLEDMDKSPYRDPQTWFRLKELQARNGLLVSGKGKIGLFGFIFGSMGRFLFNNDYPTLFEALSMQSRMEETIGKHYEEMIRTDLTSVTELQVPATFMIGKYDPAYPALLTWYEKLRAPQKKLHTFELSAHFPFLEEPDKFQQAVMESLENRAER